MKWWECEVQLPVPWSDVWWCEPKRAMDVFFSFFFRIHKNGRCYFNDGKSLPLGFFFLPFELGNLVRSFAFGFFKRMYWQPLNGYLYVPLVWGHWWNGKSIILEGSTCDLQGVRRVVTCHTYSRYVYCWSCWMILKVWVEVWFGLIVMVTQSTCNLLVKYS